MQITAEGKAIMSGAMQDIWGFIKEEWIAKAEDDKYWEMIVQKVEALCEKYDRHPAVVQLMLGYCNYLETEGSGRERTQNRHRPLENYLLRQKKNGDL